MSRGYRHKRKKSPLKIIIVILLVALTILVTQRLISSLIKPANEKKISQNTDKKDKQRADEKQNLENQNIDQEQKNEVEVPKEVPTDYKKGTSHNNEATAWAYSTKDVSTWITQPSTYTGTDKLVFLTFDDGPSNVYTNKVLDILKNYGVHATFFIVGTAADRDYAGPILKRELTEGHAIAYHSYSHDYSHLYPNRVANMENILNEVEENRKAIAKSLGDEFQSTVLRYPGGHMSWKGLADTDNALAQKGIYHIDWNVLTSDAEAKGSRRDLQGALDNIKEDMNMYQNPKIVVVLMHDIKEKSVVELPQIIEYFSSLGYKFAILS